MFLLFCVGAHAYGREQLTWDGEVRALWLSVHPESMGIRTLGIEGLVVYDLHGRRMWSSKSGCFSEAKHSNRLWIADGRYGKIVDKGTGKVLLKSKRIRGIEAIDGLADTCYHTTLSPDGRFLFSGNVTTADDEFEPPILEYELMAMEVDTGKVLWRGKNIDAPVGGKHVLMPDDASFVVSYEGVFSRNGRVLWVFPTSSYGSSNVFGTKLPARHPDKLWASPDTSVSIRVISRDGKYMLGQEGEFCDPCPPAPGYIYVGQGDPGKPWKKILLTQDVESFHGFSDVFKDKTGNSQGPYVAVLDEKRNTAYLFRVDGTIAWSKEVDSKRIRTDAGVGECQAVSAESGITFFRAMVLFHFSGFTDIYRLEDGTLVKRVFQHGNGAKVAERKPAPYGGLQRPVCEVTMLDEKEYVNLTWMPGLPGQKKRIMVWTGSVDEPD
ncbi:MAG: hypothetical protein HZB91_02065 [Elusimicrobia bacterium]|nr:hypothetical protein [Elusimicrobiota bacterium]